jgi:uncharacterized protein (AIM24 family)
MAEFSVRNIEGMRQVSISIRDETVRAVRGAMSTLTGDIVMTPRLPGAKDLFRAMFTSEARIRPFYSGTGVIQLQPALSGYHVLEINEGERWILEPGSYWASEVTAQLGLYRESFWPGLWAGDGPLVWKTTVTGHGKVAISAPGPVEIVDIDEADIRVQGRLVLGRTDGLRFRSVRAAKFPRNLIAGQRRLRQFEGAGKALVCWTPYWNEYLYDRMTGGETIRGTIFD